MKRQSKLNSTEQQQSRELGTEQQTQQSALEFATTEEMLRYDAAQTTVPGSVAQRLAQTTSELAPPSRPWWKRWFKR